MKIKFSRLLILLALVLVLAAAIVGAPIVGAHGVGAHGVRHSPSPASPSLCNPVPAYQVWLLKFKPTPVVDAPFSIPTQDPAKPTPIGLCDPTIHYTLPGTPTP